MKKKLLSFIAAFAMIVSVLVIPVSAEQSSLPDEVDGVITLNDNVTLTEKYVVNEGTTLTIDLNGFTLTGPNENYTIENSGNLTIKDSEKKGKIVGKAPSSSCVRNLGKLKIDSITIESEFVAIKNDAAKAGDSDNPTNKDMYGELIVENSVLTSNYNMKNTGTILNWGKATITNSVVTSKGVAFYATSGANAGKDSELNIINTQISGVYSIVSTRNKTDTTVQTVNISGGILAGSMQGSNGTNWNFDGNIEYQSDNVYVNNIILPNSKEGTNILITSTNFSKTLNIPENVTVTTSENTTLTISINGVSANNLIIKGTVSGMNVLSSYNNRYYPTLKNAISKVSLDDNTNYTMKLLNDTTETENININRKNITIDLNGKMISLKEVLNVDKKGHVKLIDTSETVGKVDGTITNKGTLIIENGNYTQAPVTVEGATTTLNGGTYPTENMDSVVIPEDKEIAKNDDGTYSIVYKGADYSKVDEAIKRAEALKKDEYKDFSKVQAAIDAVDRNKNITEQEIVDAYAKAINDAIDQLEKADSEPTPEKPSKPEEETVSITLMPVVDGKTVEEQSDTIDGVFKGFKFTDEEIKKLEEESKDFDFEGYVFKGYYLDKEGKEKLTSKYVFEKDTTIYMIWEKSGVTVTPEIPKGEVPAKVETAKEEVKKQTVKTGDNTDMTVYVLSGTLALAGLATILVNKKRKELLDK